MKKRNLWIKELQNEVALVKSQVKKVIAERKVLLANEGFTFPSEKKHFLLNVEYVKIHAWGLAHVSQPMILVSSTQATGGT